MSYVKNNASQGSANGSASGGPDASSQRKSDQNLVVFDADRISILRDSQRP